jgi:hypothetical protein
MKSTIFLSPKKCTDISEESTAPIFRIEEKPNRQLAGIKHFISDDGTAVRSSETSVNFYRTTRRHIPEVNTVQ